MRSHGSLAVGSMGLRICDDRCPVHQRKGTDGTVGIVHEIERITKINGHPLSECQTQEILINPFWLRFITPAFVETLVIE